MTRMSYNLSWVEDYLHIKVTRRAPDRVFLPGKTRAQVTRDVLFLLHVMDVPVNKDRLQFELDREIWQYVPKREWY